MDGDIFPISFHISYLALSRKQMNNGGFCLGVQRRVGFVNAFLLRQVQVCVLIKRGLRNP